MSDEFVENATKILNKIGVIDLQYARIDGKPLFKIGLDKIDLLKKYFKIILISTLEDYTLADQNPSIYIYKQTEKFLKAEDYSDLYIRKLKIIKINEQNIHNK